MKKNLIATVALMILGFVVDQWVMNQPSKETLKNKLDSTILSSGINPTDVIFVDMKEQGQLTSCSLDGKVMVNKNMMNQFDIKQIRQIVIHTKKLCNQALLQ